MPLAFWAELFFNGGNSRTFQLEHGVRRMVSVWRSEVPRIAHNQYFAVFAGAMDAIWQLSFPTG